MGQDANDIREEIDETRERMGDTVDAISYKADVRSRIRDSITGTVGGLRDRAAEMMPDMRDVQGRAAGLAGTIRENPLGLFFGAAAVGFLLGSLIPITDVENERLGPIGDQLKDQAQQRVAETVSAVRDVATQAMSDAISQTTGS